VTSTPLTSLADTHTLAVKVAQALRAGDTVLLSGDLGTGKTTFAQSLIRHLVGADVEVLSPTFNLVQHYPMHLGNGGDLFHYDLYRIEKPDALREIGLEEAEEAIRVIEWPERLPQDFAPHSWLSLHFTYQGGDRSVSMRAHGPIEERMANA
jgi:tRNA threonylcarbamoyladenosine biosynthesis protein TsaE